MRFSKRQLDRVLKTAETQIEDQEDFSPGQLFVSVKPLIYDNYRKKPEGLPNLRWTMHHYSGGTGMTPGYGFKPGCFFLFIKNEFITMTTSRGPARVLACVFFYPPTGEMLIIDPAALTDPSKIVNKSKGLDSK